MDSKDLAHFLADHQIEAEIVHLRAATPTVVAAAAVVDVEAAQIIKSVLFLADREPVLVIANGLARVAWKKLADYVGVSRKRLKMAEAAQVPVITGYQAGMVPPFGHRQKLRTVVDTAVYNQSIVYGGGGEINALMRLTTAELKRVVGSETAVLTEQQG